MKDSNLSICIDAETQTFPLSYAQQRIWFLQELDPASSAYNMPYVLRMSAHLNRDALARALTEINRRHEALRLRFRVGPGDEPVQWIDSPAARFPLAIDDLREVAEDRREQEAFRRVRRESIRPFDLGKDALLRAGLLRMGEEDHILFICLHHIAADGWSLEILARELGALYAAFCQGRESPLPELPIQYVDYAVWQRERLKGARLDEQLQYWKTRIAGLEPLDLPAVHSRAHSPGRAGGIYTFHLDEKLTRALHILGRRENATLFMTLLAALNVLLSRWTGQTDIGVGTVVAGRSDSQLENVIGCFVNTLILRSDLSGNPGFRKLLAQARKVALEAYRHQDLALELLGNAGHLQSLFRVMFVLQNMPKADLVLAGAGLEKLERIAPQSAKFDLSLFAIEQKSSELLCVLEYAADLFSEMAIARMAVHFRRLLEGIVANPECPVGQLPMLSAEERRQILEEFSKAGTIKDWAQDAADEYDSITDMIGFQVRAQPKAVALMDEEGVWTLEQLDREATRLSRVLTGLGIGPESIVAICVERSAWQIVAMLGVLRAGAAYLALDADYPEERLNYMVRDAGVEIAITRGTPAPLGLRSLRVEDLPEPRDGTTARRADPLNLVYLIYTSGSTGNPKGVMVSHSSLVNQARWMKAQFALGPRDRVIYKASAGFDASLLETLIPLALGCSVAIVPPGRQYDVEYLSRFLEEREITYMDIVPTLLGYLLASEKLPALPRLRIVTSGAEVLPPALMADMETRFPGVLFNTYGPTETTVQSTFRDCRLPLRGMNVPIGVPLANTQCYVLDPWLEPAPVDVRGELYIGGAGVARGYLNRSDLTAERFIPDPFSDIGGERLYRTGDLARYLSDGALDYLGRADRQVKIRGFRIEPGEVEARLSEHPSVADALVMVREDTPGNLRLVAYYTASGASSPAESADELRTHLAATLPEFMVPAAYVRLKSLPLTPNGKVDRNALPAPDAEAYASQRFEEPQGETETAIAALWADMLKVDRIGRHDNFFSLGGHSMLAVALVERMRRSGLHTDVRALFAAPTPAGLAASVGRDIREIDVPPNRIPPQCEAITPEMLTLVRLSGEEIGRIVSGMPGGAANVHDIYPLAPLQEGILFHHMMGGKGDTYLMASLLSFDSRTRLDAYLKAMQTVIDRHDVLRTAVVWEGFSEPVQVVLRRAALPVEEVVLSPSAGDVATQLYARFNPRQCRLDVRQAPWLRACIADDPDQSRWLLVLLHHHLAGDHTTLEVVLEEIQEILLGRADQLPAPLPFRNLVAQGRLGVSQEEHEAFFRRMLRNVEEPTTPFGMLDVQGDGGGIREARFEIAGVSADRLRERVRKLGVSAASLIHLAWALVLSRVSGREDVVFGTLLFGRMQGVRGSDRMMGLFINTLPIRIDVGGETAEASVLNVHRRLTDLMRHEHAPLSVAQRCSAVPARSPLFSALLNYRHTPAASKERLGEAKVAWQGIEMLYGEERTNYPFVLNADDFGDGFLLTAQVQSPIEPMRVCEFMNTALQSLVEALETAPATAARRLNVLPDFEREQVLHTWNDTRVEGRIDACIHRLFEEQALRTPLAVAVVADDRQWSYHELNERAGRLAQYLRSLSVGPEVRVGLCVERSLEMVMGILGILKAGGAYVPLDPSYPEDRLVRMLEDSRPAVLLRQDSLRSLFPRISNALPVIDLVADAFRWKDLPSEGPKHSAAEASPEHPAYVIYTSGSTGLPKGVVNEHRGVVNRLLWMQEAFRLDAHDAVLQKTPFSFDVSVWEFFWPLAVGARLVMARPEGHKDPAYLCETIRQNQITTMHFVPSMLQVFLEHADAAQCAGLKRVVCSGEALPAALARRFQESLPAAALHNLYGPTEAAVDVTAWTCPPGFAEDSVPIGRPIANTQIYILDGEGRPSPVHVAGELYIGGVQVARGYLNKPEVTAERFVPDPFANIAGARLYRTGDLARWREDGMIGYLGRNDFQVKIRGFRIELGEIEARLAEIGGVRESLVTAREDTPGEKQLVAYVVKQERADLDVAAIRDFLKRGLPDYMMPGSFIMLDELPLTPNGKVDRKRLPAPEESAGSPKKQYVAPRTVDEEILCAIWEKALRKRRVGVHDDFFELGGHSLLATRLLLRIRSVLNIEAPLRTLFETPTVAGLAEWIERDRSQSQSAALPAPTHAQELLADIWSDLLKREQIGIRENFFALGGNSPLAARMRHMIHETLNLDIPLARILESPTIAQLAALVSESSGLPRESSSPALVSIQSGLSGVPFFCVHPVAGSVLYYADLARALGGEQPFYGLQSPVLESGHRPRMSIERMAEFYNREVRDVQPTGPYLLGGWSMGGLIALEMARQLSGQGETIALLAMFDTLPPERHENEVEPILARFAVDLSCQMGIDTEALGTQFPQLSADEQWMRMLETMTQEGVLAPDTAQRQLRNLAEAFAENSAAAENYVPRKIPQRIVFFRPSNAEGVRDLEREWSKWTDGGVELHVVSGDHYTMMKPAHVSSIAGCLKTYMNPEKFGLHHTH